MKQATPGQAGLLATLWIENGTYLPTQRGYAVERGLALSYDAADTAIKELNAAKGWHPATAPMEYQQWLYISQLEEEVNVPEAHRTAEDASTTWQWADARISMLKRVKRRMGVRRG